MVFVAESRRVQAGRQAEDGNKVSCLDPGVTVVVLVVTCVPGTSNDVCFTVNSVLALSGYIHVTLLCCCCCCRGHCHFTCSISLTGIDVEYLLLKVGCR